LYQAEFAAEVAAGSRSIPPTSTRSAHSDEEVAARSQTRAAGLEEGAVCRWLIDRSVELERSRTDELLELDAEYYMSKNSNSPLERFFNLVGANLRAWYDEVPKVQRDGVFHLARLDSNNDRSTDHVRRLN
jgi:DNA polymerase elongation subunit (family B)